MDFCLSLPANLSFVHCSLPWKSCLSECCLDTDLRKRYLVTGNPNMWEVSMGGSHIPFVPFSSCQLVHDIA
jgi:hypothetical protein